MSGRSLWFVVLAVISAGLRVGQFNYGDEPKTVPAAASTPEADRDEAKIAAAIELTLDVIDLVLEHHIDPPTRPEIMRRIAEGLYQSVSEEIPEWTDGRADKCANRAESCDFLTELRTDLTPTIAARNRGEVLGGRTLSISERRRTRGEPNQRITFHDSLDSAISSIAPGVLRLLPTWAHNGEEQFEANRYVGIGVVLMGRGESDYLALHRLPDGPAARSGLLDGDLVESLDGKSMKGVDNAQLVERIRGPEGTKLTLVVRQPGAAESRTLTITRSVILRDTVRGWNSAPDRPVFRVDPNRAIGYVKISRIGGSTVHELRQIERHLMSQEIRALVIDLSNCAPGSHHFGVLLADALLDCGTIGRVRTKTRVQEFAADRDCLFRGWPLAIVVDVGTSNTGEWLAATLQDNRRAIIVGQPTRGDSFTFSSFPVSDGAYSLQLATGTLERPSGKRLARLTAEATNTRTIPQKGPWGVQPDHSTVRSDLSITKAHDVLQAEIDLLLTRDPTLTPNLRTPRKRNP